MTYEALLLLLEKLFKLQKEVYLLKTNSYVIGLNEN